MNPNIDLELIRRLLLDSGVNLAGQQTPGETPGEPLADIPPPGSYGFYTPDFSYGSYQMPYEDPTYRSGFEYARTIAGGMPFEDVVAPGMSFSPDQPMGYTQRDLTKERIYGDFDGVMPVAPTKGTPFAPNEGFVQMPSAPQGVSAPTRILPDKTEITGIPDYLKGLDFSSLPGAQEPSEPQFGSSAPAGFIPPTSGSFNSMAFVDYYNPTTGETWSAPSGGWTAPEGWVIGRPDGGLKFTFDESTSNSSEPSPKEDFFKVDQNLFNFEEIADKIDMDEVAKIDIEKIDIPESVSLFSDIFKEPVSAEPVSAEPVITEPVMPSFPIQQPMDFTGLFQVPSTPYIVGATPRPNGMSPVQGKTSGSNAIGPAAVAPINIPNIPMNFTGLPNIPVPPAAQVYIPPPPPPPAYTQPRVEDIVAPIRAGSLRRFQQPGLFQLA